MSPPAPRRLCTHILSLAVLSFSASEEPLKLTHCAWRWSLHHTSLIASTWLGFIQIPPAFRGILEARAGCVAMAVH